jgi:hypothetical protein
MLEAFILHNTAELFNIEKEKFEDSKYGGNKNNNNSTDNFYYWFFMIIYLLLIGIPLGILACYLSWKSNTLIEWGTGFKVLFAFFAFFGPINYLFSHLIHKYDLLTYIKKERTGTVFNNIQ